MSKTLLSLSDISISTISNLTDSKINKIFIEARYGDSKNIHCGYCGSTKKYNIKDSDTNNIVRFKCFDCMKFYSITTGTIFENHKLPLKTYLLIIILWVNSAKGISSLQIARDLNISSKVAYLILQKIRISLYYQFELLSINKLSGTVQMDGCYITHKPKQKNKKADRIDRRKVSNINQKCLITMRQINDDGLSYNSYAFVVRSENSSDITSLVERYVEKDTTIVTDEHNSYKILNELGYESLTVNHSIEFQDKNGTNTNQAESYFSRFRRMVIGQHHKLSNKYLDLYMNEITYRENNKNLSNKDMLIDVIAICLKCRNNTIFNDYHRRNNKVIPHFSDYVKD